MDSDLPLLHNVLILKSDALKISNITEERWDSYVTIHKLSDKTKMMIRAYFST